MKAQEIGIRAKLQTLFQKTNIHRLLIDLEYVHFAFMKISFQYHRLFGI